MYKENPKYSNSKKGLVMSPEILGINQFKCKYIRNNF